MRRFYAGILGLMLAMPAWADGLNLEPLLNKVTLRLTAEEWVVSKTALLTIDINIAVSDKGMDKVQGQILAKLQQLSNQAPWHITSFARSLDQSGLEKIQITAQTRLPENLLSGVRDRAKSLTQPGETYTLSNIQFTPSEDEVRAATMDLRNNIYEQTLAEMARLNKLMPEQKYFIHDINFLNEVMPMAMATNAIYMQSQKIMSANVLRPALAVGDKMTLIATVTLAASPQLDTIKNLHN
jgi:hypothetical protein